MLCQSCKYRKTGITQSKENSKPKEQAMKTGKKVYTYCSNHKSMFYRLDVIDSSGCEMYNQI